MQKVLHFSSHDEDCGIAKYQENYLKELAKSDNTENEFFYSSPYKTREMGTEEYDKVIHELVIELRKYDTLHIQHEFGFFRHDQLEKMVNVAKSLGKKVVVTYHTSPDLIIIKKPLTGIGPRSVISYLRSRRHNNKLIAMHITPLLSADRVLAHNEYTRHKLVEYGVPTEKVTIIPHPTYDITKPAKTTDIAHKLHKKDGDIIYSTVGYLHRFKGIDKAVKALSYLPDNYKLAILGGVKSDSDDQKLYDEIADLIVSRDLKDRVYITGVIESDETLNSYIRETDFCVYAYDSSYYKGVGSGSLNLAIANERPIVAFPVSTFKETNEDGHLTLTGSDSYYELAKEIEAIDLKAQAKKITDYAKQNSWENRSKELISVYESI